MHPIVEQLKLVPDYSRAPVGCQRETFRSFNVSAIPVGLPRVPLGSDSLEKRWNRQVLNCGYGRAVDFGRVGRALTTLASSLLGFSDYVCCYS